MSGNNVRIDAVDELMLVPQLRPVQGFPIYAVGFAADMVGHTGHSHEVSLVGAVDEAFRLDGDRAALILAGYRTDTRAFFIYTGKVVSFQHLDLGIVNPAVNDFACHMRLEPPLFLGPVAAAEGTVEFPGHSPDGQFIADVCHSQATGSHTSQYDVRADYGHIAAFLRCSARSSDGS